MSERSSKEGIALQPRGPETNRAERGYPDPETLRAAVEYGKALAEALRRMRVGAAPNPEEKAASEREAIRFEREMQRVLKQIGDALLDLYRPLIEGTARRLVGRHTHLYPDVVADLSEAYLKAKIEYDGERPFACFVVAYIKAAAKQSLSLHRGHDGLGSKDRLRRTRPVVKMAVRNLERQEKRVPTDEEVVAALATNGTTVKGTPVTLDEVARVRWGRPVTLEAAEREGSEDQGLALVERLDRVRATFAGCWSAAKLDRVDIFLITVSRIAEVKDGEFSAWARRADGGALGLAVARVCEGLSCKGWPEVQARVGVPKHLRATPTEAYDLLGASGASTETASLQKRRKRKEAALRNAVIRRDSHDRPSAKHQGKTALMSACRQKAPPLE